MDDVKYLAWPYGKLGSKERVELKELKQFGYEFSDPFECTMFYNVKRMREISLK